MVVAVTVVVAVAAVVVVVVSQYFKVSNIMLDERET